MLTIVTTSWCLTEKLAATVNSTALPGVARHVVSYSSADGLSEAEFFARCKRGVTLRFAAGCSIAAGFNLCLRECPEAELLLVLNEGDLLVGCEKSLAKLHADPECDAVVGHWSENGTRRSVRRAISFENALHHGMGFNHSACIFRRRFHEKYGRYPENYPICMDYALVLGALKRGARFGLVDELVVEVEKPGVSGDIWARSAEHREIVRPYLGPFKSRLLWAKWIINSHLQLLLRVLGK